MRITNSMLISNTIWNLNKKTESLSKVQQKIATQSQIQLPSDDPVVATRAIKYRNYISKTQQYQDNVNDALSWQKVTENALSDMGNVLQRVRELTVQASSDTITPDDRQQIKEEILQMKGQTVQILNTSYAGRYVFGGYKTDQPPYALKTQNVGDQTFEKVTFKDQYVNLGSPLSSKLNDSDISNLLTANSTQLYATGAAESIKYNIGYGNQIAVNIEGPDVVGSSVGNNLFDTIDQLLLGLDGETAYTTAQLDNSLTPAAVSTASQSFKLTDCIAGLDRGLERIMASRSDLGARMKYLEITGDRLSTDYITYSELMSNNEDVDLAQAATEMSTAQYVYEASLAVGSKVMNKSLVDFLT